MIFLILCCSVCYEQTNFTVNPLYITSGSTISILDCFFHALSSSSYSAGIFVQYSTIHVEICRCGFFKCTCSHGAPSSGGITLFSVNYASIVKSCLDYCSSPHGQSYGIYGDNAASCLVVHFNLTYETRVGANSRPTHSSYIGGFNGCFFSNNNISDCSVWDSCGCGFYFYTPKDTTYISFNQIARGYGISIIFFYTTSCCPSMKSINVINNTITNYYINMNQNCQSIRIESFVFARNSNVPLYGSTHISSPPLIFIDCAFDIAQVSLITNNCIMSSGNRFGAIYDLNYISSFHINACLMKGELINPTLQLQRGNIVLFSVFFMIS